MMDELRHLYQTAKASREAAFTKEVELEKEKIRAAVIEAAEGGCTLVVVAVSYSSAISRAVLELVEEIPGLIADHDTYRESTILRGWAD